MSSELKPTVLIIVGITGDLSKRYLLPAIASLARAKALPEQFQIVGISRRDVTTSDVLGGLSSSLDTAYLAAHTTMYKMDLANPDEYDTLSKYLDDLDKTTGQAAQRLFYLSVPPQFSSPIVECLGASGLSKRQTTKLLLEKPFGTDYSSAKEFISHLNRSFTETQIYRIDHYVAKEMTQNLIVFRNSNSIFKRTWNKDFIEKIDINVFEKIGIENRAIFYEQTGALRDVVQSHMLQLLALCLMKLPPIGNWQDVPALRLEALKQIHCLYDKVLAETVLRAQYKGYREEVGNPKSATETFVRLNLVSDDPLWKNVPITLTTGKNLAERSTEIRIYYKQIEPTESNQLIFRIQPNEGIELCLWSKRPGYDWELEMVPLSFSLKGKNQVIPDAYEKVFLDAIRSDHSLFTSSEEVLASWKILEPIQDDWSMQTDELTIYDIGSNPSDVQPLLK
jgi:glucose-6-phosphate 1-dehydrogenase